MGTPNERRNWVTKNLGVKASAGGTPPSAKDLKDSDFPTDIKQRKKADEEAKRLGKERAQEKPKDKSKGPPKDPADAIIDEVFGDPQKKLVAMAKYKVPRFTEIYSKNTPEKVRFLSDLQTGLNKAQEYCEYINKTAAYVQKFGDLTKLDGIRDAAAKLQSITGKLGGGLAKVSNLIEDAKKIRKFIEGASKFATASSQMDPRDRKSVKAWVSAMEDLWDSTAPFAEWLQNKAATAAIVEGSEVGAALSATLAIVGAEIYVGIKLLEAGVKVESAYFDKMSERMKEIFPEDYPPPAEREEPPPYPKDDWMSWDEAADRAPEWEDAALKASIRGEERRKREEHEEKIYEATKDFDEKIFVKTYQDNRSLIRAQILQALRKAGKKTATLGGDPESKWWDCLAQDMNAKDPNPHPDDDSFTGGDFFDKEAGIYVYPTKAKVSATEAQDELSAFSRVVPPCRFVADLRSKELKKYLDKTVPAEN